MKPIRVGIIPAALFLMACGVPAAPPAFAPAADTPLTAPVLIVADTGLPEAEEMPYATYYLVVADTGANYYALQRKMVRLSSTFGILIDTMGRYYNAQKERIVLPDNDEDEMYAGEYYPRREPSEHLSLEYLSVYQDGVPEKTIALVRGIYGSEAEAQKALAALRPGAGTAFAVKARVYVGCMH